MTTKGVQVCCLDVGQGMCTFVEIYNTSDKVIRTLLFDLGSSKNSKVAGPATVAYLAAQIKARNPPNGTLDAVFVSHKDSDHVSLIPLLLEAVPNADIGKVFYGGRYSWYKSVLDKLKERCASGDDVKGFPVGETQWVGDKFTSHLWQADDVTVYLFVGNAPHGSEVVGTLEKNISKEPDGDQANSKSLVCIVSYKGDGWCISGDATFPTMGYANAVLGDKKLAHTRMMLMPHHGSRKTTFGLRATDAEISEEALLVVKTFAEKVGARTLIASADTKHSHPSLETISVFQNYTDFISAWWTDPTLKGDCHYLSTYLDLSLDVYGEGSKPTSGAYTTFQTSWNVYSTLYANPGKVVNFEWPAFLGRARYVTPPSLFAFFPYGMNWFYWIPKANEPITLVGRDSNRVTLLAPKIGIAPQPFETLRAAAAVPRPVHLPPRAPLFSADALPLPRIRVLV